MREGCEAWVQSQSEENGWLALECWKFMTQNSFCLRLSTSALFASLVGLPCIASSLRETLEEVIERAEGELTEANPSYKAFSTLSQYDVMSCEITVPYALDHRSGVVKEDRHSVLNQIAECWDGFPPVIRSLLRTLLLQEEEASKKLVMRCLACYAWSVQQHVFSFFLFTYQFVLSTNTVDALEAMWGVSVSVAPLHSIILHYLQSMLHSRSFSSSTLLSTFTLLQRALARYCAASSSYEAQPQVDFSTVETASPYLRTGAVLVMAECVVNEMMSKKPSPPKQIEVVEEMQSCCTVDRCVQMLQESSDDHEQLYVLYSVLEIIAVSASHLKNGCDYLLYRFFNWFVMILRTVPDVVPVRSIAIVVVWYLS